MAFFLYNTFCATAILQTLLVVVFLIGLFYRLKRKENCVCIIVLGDIGRSPRMQYHAISYAKEKYIVKMVGFHGSAPVADLMQNEKVSFHYLTQMISKPSWMPGFFFYIIKAIFYSSQLLFLLVVIVGKPGHYIIQNPPGIPTLAVVWLLCCINGSKMVVDWHNYGYTILSLNTQNKKSLLVRFAKWFESFFGYLADKNICVTRAMKNDLKDNWKINADVLYDRPPEHFCETAVEDKHHLFRKLTDEGYFHSTTNDISTLFTHVINGKISLKKTRPAIVISSTSWTEDEDFSVLLRALEIYDNNKTQNKNLPELVCIITGKGPLKLFYENVIKEKSLKHTKIITPWLSMEDYPKIIGSGDIGVCLHTSSSGLDLPMKVVDMFGCGLPVCAIKFDCLHELVKHDENGLIFEDSKELASQLIDLLTDFPVSSKLMKYKENLRSFQESRWHNNWFSVIPQLINEN